MNKLLNIVTSFEFVCLLVVVFLVMGAASTFVLFKRLKNDIERELSEVKFD